MDMTVHRSGVRVSRQGGHAFERKQKCNMPLSISMIASGSQIAVAVADQPILCIHNCLTGKSLTRGSSPVRKNFRLTYQAK